MQKVRCVQFLYGFVLKSTAEKTLVALHKQRSDRIEEIKKKTNYYTTRNLLERYDESPSPGRGSPHSPASPLAQAQARPATKPPAKEAPPQQTPQRPAPNPALLRTPYSHLVQSILTRKPISYATATNSTNSQTVV
jgi:hypothetical protein